MCTRSILGGVVAIMLGVAVITYAQIQVPGTIPATSPASQPVPATQADAGPKLYTATSLPPRFDISLDPAAMWTELPPQVKGACQGTDGRVWLQVEVWGARMAHEGGRELIRREYGQEMPQACLIRPVLFEPGGRIWFRVQTGLGSDSPVDLIGYDGSTFIERTDLKEDFRTREWGSAGKLGGALCAYADGRAFFAIPGAIHVYDGKEWTSRELPGTPVNNGGYINEIPATCRLYVEPDGKGVLAVDQNPSKPLWRWRTGTWVRHSTGILGGTSTDSSSMQLRRINDYVLGVGPRQHGVWLLTREEGLTFIPFDEVEAASSQPITIATLIGQLAVEETRELAAHELAAHGRAAEPELRRALAAAENPQLRARLEEIIKGLPEIPGNDRPVMERGAPYQSWKFGRYTVSSVYSVLGLPDGGTVLHADRVLDASGKPAVPTPANPDPKAAANPWEHAPATLLQEPGGAVRPIGDPGTLMTVGERAFRNGQYETVVPLSTDGGRRLWTPGDPRGMPPQLLDLASGRVVAHLPLPGIMSVDAVAGDGTMFLAAQHEMVAFRPGGKDARRLLEPMAQVSAAYSRELAEVFTADGCYWFSEPVGDSDVERVIARFNGKTFETYSASQFSLARPFETIKMAPGRDGVLVEANKSWLLVTPRGVHQGMVLEDLIAQNASEVAATFATPRPIHGGEQPTHVVADVAGNLWLVRRPSGEIKVLAAGLWLDAGEALKKAGDLRGHAFLILPLADSAKVLVVDREPFNTPDASRGKTSYIMSVTGKTITAEPVPDVTNPNYNAEFPCDLSGDTWVDAYRDPHVNPSLAACRMTARGPVDWIDHATLLTGDSAGRVWVMFRPPGAGAEEIRMYREGKFIPPPMPIRMDIDHFWSGPGGTLCYASVLGLHVLKVTRRGETLTWDAPEILHFDGIESAPNIHGISPRGFIVASPTRTTAAGLPNLFFYPLGRP